MKTSTLSIQMIDDLGKTQCHEVVATIQMIDDLGKTQYQRFVEERINDDVTTFHDTI